MNELSEKVFCIGLNKTGTTSIGAALEILGYKNRVSYKEQLLFDWSAGNFTELFKTAEENNCFEDWPWPLVYRQMYNHFQHAKFILTIRQSPEEWYISLCKHMERKGFSEATKLIYGHYMPHDFKDEYIQNYTRHNEGVINFFTEKDNSKLLVLNLNQGNNWDKLCPFLNKQKPHAKFPHLNQSKDIIHIQKNDLSFWKLLQDRFYVRFQRLKKLFHF